MFPDGSLHRGIIRSATTRLNGGQLKDLLETLTKPVEFHESDDCYDPHHAFVFYNTDCKPVGWFAVCWRCGTYAGGSRKFPEYIELAPVRKLTKESLHVTCYEGVRIPFIMAGWMDDFIPKIGGMLVWDGNPHAVLGYIWRYLGNGGGMGMAFVCSFTLLRRAWVTPRIARYTGLCFGCFVWACLIITLKVSPHGEEVMFVVTPVSLLLSWIGHVVFGYTLGWLVGEFGQDG